MIKQPALPRPGRAFPGRARATPYLHWSPRRLSVPAVPPVCRYRHVLIATDFAATTDSYHRDMVHLAHALGSSLSLMHLHPDAIAPAPVHDPERHSAAILLDGLSMRLGLRPQIAWVTEFGRIDEVLAGAARALGVDLVITGAPASMPGLRHCRRIAELGPALGYHVITRNDEPERD